VKDEEGGIPRHGDWISRGKNIEEKGR